MRLILLSAILTATTLAHAQAPAVPSPMPPMPPVEDMTARPPRPTPKGRLTGHVLCNDTRQPARGATVMLQPLPTKEETANQERQTQTLFARVGLDGVYTVNHVPTGDYAILAFFPGYLSLVDDVTVTDQNDGTGDPEKAFRDKLASSGQVVHISAEGTQTADVMLERGATVSGRVLYTDGAPATQVTIYLEDVNAKPSAKPGVEELNMGAIFRTMFTHQTLSTDDEGRFRVSGIHPGTYRIAALQPFSVTGLQGGADDGMGEVMGMGLFGGAGESRTAHFYAGDTFHKKSAKTYELRAGETLANLDIRLPIDGLQDIRIHLAATDGRPINSATLTLTDTTDDSVAFTLPSTQGANRDPTQVGNVEGIYEFHSVPPGTYTVAATDAKILVSHMVRSDPANFPKGFDLSKIPEIPQIEPIAGFNDATATVIVKDSSATDLNLTLTLTENPKKSPSATTPPPTP